MSGESIEKTRLADVGRPENDDTETFAQPFAAASVIEVGTNVPFEGGHLRPVVIEESRRQFLVGKVDHGLEAGHGVHKALTPPVIKSRMHPLELVESLMALA